MIKLAGYSFSDPIIIASGGLPNVPDLVRRVCKEYRPSAITIKTVTLNPLAPHRAPTVIKVGDSCYINAIGMNNPGANIINEFRDIECPLIGSITGTDIDEIVKAAEIVEKQSIIIEINASSPNRPGMGMHLLDKLSDIVKNVASMVKKPVFVKLPPVSDIIRLVERSLSSGARGVTLINTVRAMAIDIENLKPILSFIGGGGLSGKCIYPVALRIIYDVYREFSDIDIIGMGGVFSWKDAVGLMSAGAKLVGLCTVLMEKGYDAINEIRSGLYEYLEEKKLTFNDIIGAAHRF
jgi:dihydroorotate dehydrogenase (fumarate)